MQIDSTPLDVMVLLDDGVPVRADLTIAVDVATRTICAAVLRPVGTKAVDAALLLARMLVPEPMRPGWAARAADVGLAAAARPAARHRRADGAGRRQAGDRPGHHRRSTTARCSSPTPSPGRCERLGISVQPARPQTPTDKAIVEATFGSINTLFCQHVAGYTGSNTARAARDLERGAWTMPELQDLLDEWLIAGWQPRPHDSLRDPRSRDGRSRRTTRYAALVAAAGYLPVTLTGEDYLELLPVAWRAINDYGIRIDYRTYDGPELGPLAAPALRGHGQEGALGGALRPLRRVAGVPCAPPRAGSPSRGRTGRWSLAPSPTSPGVRHDSWPPNAAATAPTKPPSPAPWTTC